jgi:ssDNA-binding Zn-finger/Zn-ribbon topoisomerase 1
MLAVRLPELSCDACGGKGLCRGEADDSAGDWQQAIVCEICRQPIDPDRLEMFPAARRCVRCQDAAERNALPTPAEYCPRCGSLLELRVSRGGGLTRYKLFCTGNPPCRSVS